MTIAYLLDENVSHELQKQLHRHMPDLTVWIVGSFSAPPLGTLDPEILVWCQKNEFILVTNNRKSMPIHLKEHLEEGQSIPGIFILSPQINLGETVDELILIAQTYQADEYTNAIRFLPISY